MHSFNIRALIFGIFALLSLGIPATKAEETTNYRTGIDTTFLGERGVDFEEEYLYHDKLVTDRKVVYIRSSTLIALSHNERNVARVATSSYEIIGSYGKDNIPLTGDEGRIRFRVDGDLSWGTSWTDGQGGTANPLYLLPFSFALLTYPDLTPILGKTGSNGAPITDKSHYFTYGILDSFGDEWHTLQVADDDWLVTNTDTEWRASDGRVINFVVDPKTPVLTVEATGDAQFYTTPPKTYFLPKIHQQTTYIDARSGEIQVHLKALTGEKVHYRINGGDWVIADAPALTQNSFQNGENTIEYYYEGNSQFVKTRKVVKNPTWPSAGETHGFLVIGDDENYSAMHARRLVSPYKYHWDRMLTGNREGRAEWDQNRRKGLRYVPSKAFSNALIAKMNGIASKQSGAPRTFADYAKEMVLENGRTIDNVGFEMEHSQKTLPTRELTYRGYYDVLPTLDLAYAYDLLISFYRSDQAPQGITPIEDYYIRDCIANNIVECLMFSSSLQGPTASIDKGGMWDVARKCGAIAGMFAIPSYSTTYYGTCGLDGNTSVYPYTPFVDQPLTWKQVFLDDNQPLLGYPNLANRLGIEGYNCLPNGNFFDRAAYVGLMGGVFYHVANILRFHYPSKKMPAMEAFFLSATKGTIKGEKDNSGPVQNIFLPMFNKGFPGIAAAGIAIVVPPGDKDPLSDDQKINGHMPFALAWYQSDYTTPTDPGDPGDPNALSLSAPATLNTKVPWIIVSGTSKNAKKIQVKVNKKGYKQAAGTDQWSFFASKLAFGDNILLVRATAKKQKTYAVINVKYSAE